MHGTESFKTSIIVQILKKILTLYLNQMFISSSQERVSETYPEPDESRPHRCILFL
jgi:hypothetical protein